MDEKVTKPTIETVLERMTAMEERLSQRSISWSSALIQGWIASRASQAEHEVKCWSCALIFVIGAFSLESTFQRCHEPRPFDSAALAAGVIFYIKAFLEQAKVALFQIEVCSRDHFSAFLSRYPINNLWSIGSQIGCIVLINRLAVFPGKNPDIGVLALADVFQVGFKTALW